MSTEPTTDKRALEEERDFLLRSIDDLEAEWAAGDIDEADYEALRDDYTARAAKVLRRLDGRRSPGSGKPASTARQASTSTSSAVERAVAAQAFRRRVRWGLAIAGSVVLAVLAGFLVMRSSGERLPNQAATGNVPQTPLDQAEALDEAGKDPVAALKAYDALLATEPNNVEGLAREGWLLARLGKQTNQPTLLTRAGTLLDKSVSLQPDYPPARAWRGLLNQFRGENAKAVCDLQAYLSLAPPDQSTVGLVQGSLDEARAAAGPDAPTCPQLGPSFTPVTPSTGPAAPAGGGGQGPTTTSTAKP